jgi:hypothetical protein
VRIIHCALKSVAPASPASPDQSIHSSAADRVRTLINQLLQNLMMMMQLATYRDENVTDIFRPYSRPNPFRGVLIRPYPSPDI